MRQLMMVITKMIENRIQDNAEAYPIWNSSNALV
jgi:hypothetical protein